MPRLVEGYEQSFLGTADLGDRRSLAHHVLGHDGGFGGLSRHLVVILKGHDQHGIGVFAEFHEVGHPADDAAVGGFAEGRLVDRAIRHAEHVVGPAQFPAGALRLASGQSSFCDCRTWPGWSRKPISAAMRLPMRVP